MLAWLLTRFGPRALATLALTTALYSALPSQSPRVHTSRPAGSELLKLPKENDAFGFVVFGDRTGGPVEGIEVLKQAVADTNLLDPDLVLTVGDLINGYNTTDAWKAQAVEYKAAMAALRMPWFPVAGNHDIYWRGAGTPPGEHEANFEATFGPLWYAVQHKQCWFVVLYSDEGNPTTGEKDFNKPDCQRISEAQFTWLGETLQKAKGARHVFVFLHHPRWLAKYGTDWDRVHGLLAQAGNVTAVFAGHIHRMRYDGVRDGIQYYTVASVGAHLEMEAPQAGFLHQFHVVTVRPEGITVAALPVGTVIDAQQITGAISEDCERVHGALQPELVRVDAAGTGAPIDVDGSVDAIVTLRCRNAGTRAIELELIPQAGASWAFAPDHQHVIVAQGQSGETTFAIRRAALPGEPFVLPQLQVRCDYLAAHSRIGLPARTFDLELPPPAGLGRSRAASEGVLSLDGKTGCLQLPNERLVLPDGPFTVELWLRGTDFAGRRGIVAKTEQSEWSLFGSDGELDFSVFLGDRYARAASGKPVLEAGRWHHVAGVFDGAELRAYVDGQLVASQPGQGARKPNALPLCIGADPNGSGKPTAFFAGAIDEVRVSAGARYTAPFSPPVLYEVDAATVLLLPCDEPFGPWWPDHSGQHRHARSMGGAHRTVESRPGLR